MRPGFPVIFAVNATALPVQRGGINGDERRALAFLKLALRNGVIIFASIRNP